MSAHNDKAISFRGASAIHDFQLNFVSGWGYHDTGTVTLEVPGYGIEIDSDSEAQKTDEPTQASIILPRRLVFENDLSDEAALDFEEFKKACDAAWELTRLINIWNADAIAEAEENEREEDQQRQEAEEARNAIVQEREETMLQELVGERVKVRHRQYKTMCYGTVDTRPISWGIAPDGDEGAGKSVPTEWEPRIRYSDQGDTRDTGVGSYARLDAKTEKGWRTVWDDGKDDLPEYDRNVKLPKAKAWSDG